ncbi:hypothetical protein SKAU_G00293860 [Synaphobranchus kaupii]|uniref:Uncharacterized protein n=1 Tax=Synaphobranchus kaupii TaxID=118154 RepID=A0A9Q1IMJ9_SYNKA|nr:hypothetical protein SKAU_G00293860 [Synaphobranchus kaupii]
MCGRLWPLSPDPVDGIYALERSETELPDTIPHRRVINTGPDGSASRRASPLGRQFGGSVARPSPIRHAGLVPQRCHGRSRGTRQSKASASGMKIGALQFSSALIGCSEKPQPAASILGSIFVIRTAASWISWEVKLVTVALEMRLGQNARFKPHRSRPSCVPHVTFPVHRSDLPENFNGTGTLLVLPQP